MYATDVRRTSSLNAPYSRGGGHKQMKHESWVVNENDKADVVYRAV